MNYEIRNLLSAGITREKVRWLREYLDASDLPRIPEDQSQASSAITCKSWPSPRPWKRTPPSPLVALAQALVERARGPLGGGP